MLNEFTEKVNKLTNKITNKAHDTLDLAKLQSAISKAKQEIEENYKEIGRLYYENYTLDENELFTEHIARIKENEAKIISLNEQIHHLKGTKVCRECNKELKQDMSFCPYCGSKLEEEPVDEMHVEEVIVEADEPITKETEVVEDEETPSSEFAEL